ncbi:hypothetical protein RRG08_026755 [Elysia crispata]|uniref:Uncharacterized protein n=1 Tax=Elysia crispata TaxID=231223 RepID=A0AAE1E2S1_9GAST|nr:hypothetical protein RRG08_026755 [Elysia crispata]
MAKVELSGILGKCWALGKFIRPRILTSEWDHLAPGVSRYTWAGIDDVSDADLMVPGRGCVKTIVYSELTRGWVESV